MNKMIVKSPIGNLLLTEDNRFITECKLTQEDDIKTTSSSQLLMLAKQQLSEYFSQQRKIFDLPLKPNGTDFQKQVWQKLLTIPYGETWSYQQLASSLGKPSASRAVGSANGKNPIWIIIPCHRVIRASGELGGYAGGLGNKQHLLDLENVQSN